MNHKQLILAVLLFTLFLMALSTVFAQDDASGTIISSEAGDLCASDEPVVFETTYRRSDDYGWAPGNAYVGGSWTAKAGATLWLQAIGYIPGTGPAEFSGVLIVGVARNEGFPEPRYLAASGAESTLIYTFTEDDEFGVYVLSDTERDSGLPITVRAGCGEPEFVATEAPVIIAPTVVPTATPEPTVRPPSAGITRNADWTPVTQSFDGVEMVQVPAGCFMLDRPAMTVPEYEICIDEPFWMDRLEVSYEQLEPYLPQLLLIFSPEAASFDPNSAGMTQEQFNDLMLSQFTPLIRDSRSQAIPNLPPRLINWEVAKAFCELRGGRLPTTIEWEYAARGPEKWLYPWGNQPDADLWASFELNRGSSVPVDSYPEGASWVGALNMMGNVAEYTTTLEDVFTFTYPYDAEDGREDLTVIGQRIVRGTSVLSQSANQFENLTRSTSVTQNIRDEDQLRQLGIRCAMNSDGTEVVQQPNETITSTEDETAVQGFESVEINASDQRKLTVYIPTGWLDASPKVEGPGVNTSSPEGGKFDFYAPAEGYNYGESPEIRYRITPYNEYGDICVALSRLNTDLRQGARSSFSGSACDDFEGEPATSTFGANEWMMITYDSGGFITQGFPADKFYTLAVTVGKELVIEVAMISMREDHEELLESVLYPALTAFSFDAVEGDGIVGLPPAPTPYGPACTENGKPTRLFVGAQGRATSTFSWQLYAEANDESEEVGRLNGTFTVLEGPVCVDGVAWYQIDNNGLVGWIMETRSVPGSPADYIIDRVGDGGIASAQVAATTLPLSAEIRGVVTAVPVQPTNGSVVVEATSTPVQNAAVPTATPASGAAVPTSTAVVVASAPTATMPVEVCTGVVPQRMIVGQRGRVTPGAGNRLRSQPSTNANILLTIPGEAEFDVIGGPTCADGYAWWEVNYRGTRGWTVEGDDNDYWIEPVVVLDPNIPLELVQNITTSSGIFSFSLPVGWTWTETKSGEVAIAAPGFDTLFIGFIAPFALNNFNLDPAGTADQMLDDLLKSNGGTAEGEVSSVTLSLGEASRYGYTANRQDGLLVVAETADGLIMIYAQGNTDDLSSAQATVLAIANTLSYDSAAAQAAASAIECRVSSGSNANLRGGPGTSYDQVGTFPGGQSVDADGKAQGADGFIWWRLADGSGWVRQDIVTETEDCDRLPLVEPD